MEPMGSSKAWPIAAMASAVRKLHEDKVKDYKEYIDTLLVFAGLFSAVTSAFLIESYMLLKPDTSETTRVIGRDGGLKPVLCSIRTECAGATSILIQEQESSMGSGYISQLFQGEDSPARSVTSEGTRTITQIQMSYKEVGFLITNAGMDKQTPRIWIYLYL
ncbi:hypothetical protein QCA50_010100 [Cerrena zonata]|uniref:DUF6535 domain-containing protein n=1 Tax=Cerrena zonata TaxID=2478898 RepID=A0AAW0G9D9_9APHY